MQNIIISPIEEQDMEQIYALYQEFAIYEQLEDYFSASIEDLRKLIFEEKLLHMMKAELNGEMVGFAAYYYQLVSFPAKKVLYLEDIFVKEEVRGQGIGNLFLAKLEELAKEKIKARLDNINTRGVAAKKNQTIDDIYNERSSLYLKYADYVLDLKNSNVEQTVEKICNLIK